MGGFFSAFRWLYGRLGAPVAVPRGAVVSPYFLAELPAGAFLARGSGGGFLSRRGE